MAAAGAGSGGGGSASVHLSYKYRLLPTKAQHRALEAILEDQRQLYNAALEERIDAWRKGRHRITYVDQCASLTVLRRDDARWRAYPLKLLRGTIKRLDEAFAGFFRRVKARNGKAGFPRFKGRRRFDSFACTEMKGVRFNGRRLRFATMPGGLRVHTHRPLPEGSKPLAAVFRRDPKGWHVVFQVRTPAAPAREPARAVGIDVGLSALATLSTGEAIPNPRHARRAEKEMRRRQRALSRCKRGSNRRAKVRARVAKLHRKIADVRATHLHQVSARLVRDFDLIAVERLNVKGLARGMLARDVHDAAWTRLRDFLRYKAERAGAQLVEVDPRGTSQACSGCGVIVPKPLSVRVHSCPACGLTLDRDHNAALNILHRAVMRPGLAKPLAVAA